MTLINDQRYLLQAYSIAHCYNCFLLCNANAQCKISGGKEKGKDNTFWKNTQEKRDSNP